MYINRHYQYTFIHNKDNQMDQNARGKWLIHGPKHHKDNRSQSLKHPCQIIYTI